MYCNQCRRSIPDGSRYCNFCGADQKGQKSSGKSWLVSLAVFVVVLSVLYVLDNNSLGSNSNKAVAEKLAVGQDTTATFMQQEQQENNLQSISLTVAAEPRQLGDGGYCAVFETLTPVNDCKQVTLTLEAEGNHGATTKGNWEVHFRIGGQWKKSKPSIMAALDRRTSRFISALPPALMQCVPSLRSEGITPTRVLWRLAMLIATNLECEHHFLSIPYTYTDFLC